jgi:crotonobetainyl-CoA:carnitine CoA-transferase CaiB-like acyl-CoA transferase
MFAVQGILLALYHRDVHGGRGQVVDASILESCFSMLDSTVPEYGKLGVVREPQGSRIGSAVPSNVYTSRDGKYLAVAANADNIFRRLCTAVGRPELADDDRFATHWARFEHVDELDSIVGAWVGERDAAEADRILNEAGVVCGPVYSIADIFEDPHYRAREMLVTMRDEVLGEVVVPGVVPKLSETPGELRHAGSWELGRDNRAVYADLLGLEENQLAELAAEGVI